MVSTFLSPYILPKVEGLDDEIEDGHGAFGVVYKVTVDGTPCMAKRLHQILVREVSYEERTSMESKFVNECELLSKLSHPNIVHFVGVYYGRSKQDLALVMERLHTDVAAFVRHHYNVPTSIKASILLDVSYGLLYLHTHTPPIIHRDLTAPNVLLTKDIRAKIADLGVSKMLKDPQLIKQTTAPGNVHYMAPETKVQNPVYGTSVDIFSAGHLIIHVATQDWPKLYKVTDHHSVAPGRMEIAERQVALDEGMGHTHCMYDLAVSCLQDDPKQRPTTVELNKRLNSICMKHPKEFKDIQKIECEESKEGSREFEDSIRQLTEQIGKQHIEIERLTKEKSELVDVLRTQEIAAITYKDDFNMEREDRQKAHSKIAEMEQKHSQELQALRMELQESRASIEELQESLRKRSMEIVQLRSGKIDVQSHEQLQRDGRSFTVSASVPLVSPPAQSQHVLSHAASFPPDVHSNEEGSTRDADYSPPSRGSQSHRTSRDETQVPPNQRYDVGASSVSDHSYVNLRDNSRNLQQQFANLLSPQDNNSVQGHAPVTLITPTEDFPQEGALMRNRALTYSAPDLSSSQHSDDSKGKTLPSQFRNQRGTSRQTHLSFHTDKPLFSQNRVEEISPHEHYSQEPRNQEFDYLAPLTRGRSHAMSHTTPPNLSCKDVSPCPPKRHQSLSRARSNPTSERGERTRREPGHNYEHVPQRYDQLLSLPSSDYSVGKKQETLVTTDTGYPSSHVQDQKRDHREEFSRAGQSVGASRSSTTAAPPLPYPVTHTQSSSSAPNQQILARYSSLEEPTVFSHSKDHRSASDPSLPQYENIEKVRDAVRFQILEENQGFQSPSFPSQCKEVKYQQHDRVCFLPSQDSTDSNTLTPNLVRNEESFGFEYPTTCETHYNAQRTKLAFTQIDDSVDLPPLDPILVCPTCLINFRVGEIQDFRKHALECKKLKAGN